MCVAGGKAAELIEAFLLALPFDSAHLTVLRLEICINGLIVQGHVSTLAGLGVVALDAQQRVVEVDARPSQRQQLTATQATVEGRC